MWWRQQIWTLGTFLFISLQIFISRVIDRPQVDFFQVLVTLFLPWSSDFDKSRYFQLWMLYSHQILIAGTLLRKQFMGHCPRCWWLWQIFISAVIDKLQSSSIDSRCTSRTVVHRVFPKCWWHWITLKNLRISVFEQATVIYFRPQVHFLDSRSLR